MKHPRIVLGSGVVVVAVVAALVVFMGHSLAPISRSFTKPSSADRSGIDQAVVVANTTIQAGTKADVTIQQFTSTRVKGHVTYNNGYSAKDFIATKSGGTWKVTQYKDHLTY